MIRFRFTGGERSEPLMCRRHMAVRRTAEGFGEHAVPEKWDERACLSKGAGGCNYISQTPILIMKKEIISWIAYSVKL